MKIYRNKRLGFVIDVPTEWELPRRIDLDTLLFISGPGESFNFVVGPTMPQLSLEETEQHFSRYAQAAGYTDLEFGIISVGGKEHVWASYHMGDGAWTKKYLIAIDDLGYAITASCRGWKTFTQREKIWDAVATSFRLDHTYPHELNNILTMLSQLTSTDDIPKQVDLCERALVMIVREAVPELWANLQMELAKILRLDPRGNRAQNLERAIQHNKQALEVFTRQTYPREWAGALNNLAALYRHRIRGERAKNIEQAIHHYQSALEVLSRKDYPEQWAMVQNNLANVYRDRIGGDAAENFEKAISHCRQAFEVYTQEAYPWNWATAQNNLANVYQDRIAGEKAENIEQAIHHSRKALEVFTHEAYPADWAWTHSLLGARYHTRIHGEKAENIEISIRHCEQALEVISRRTLPEEWAATHLNLGNCFRDRLLGKPAANVGQAIHHYQLARKVLTQRAHPNQWEMIHDFLVAAREYEQRIMEMKLRGNPLLSYPQHYQEELQRESGEEHTLTLVESIVLDSPFVVFLRLSYQWNETLAAEVANKLSRRAIVYIACAIYDAASAVGLSCQASEIPNGRRPAWFIEGEKSPISVILSDIDVSARTCQMTIGATMTRIGEPPGGKNHWEKLHTGFKTKFSNITV